MRRIVGWPTEMHKTTDMGVVADLQCGGWSTTLLNSTGQLYAVGKINGEHFTQRGNSKLHRLFFPPGYPQSDRGRYEPATAIKQYSCGRSHVLGLSDSGKIWQWNSSWRPAMHIKFLHTDLLENNSTRGRGTVKSVVAGWDRASAHVLGTGIVHWDPGNRSIDEPGDEAEAVDGLLIDSVVVPGTAYQRQRNEPSEIRNSPDHIGEVRKHIVLEGYIVFLTDTNRVFATKTGFPEDGIHHVVELTTIGESLDLSQASIADIQGSFRSFAVFATTGEVLTADRPLLDKFWESIVNGQAVDQLPLPARIPALQHNNVISVAFGDYHFHALHSNGQISSFGTEPQSCGALGLGLQDDCSIFRGVRLSRGGFNSDGELVRQAYSSGRRIWFEREKRIWLRHMRVASEHQEARQRSSMIAQLERVNGEISEWFEQEGKGWDDFPDLRDTDETGLGSYFALSIAAAGWHSGALVLVDEDRAEKVREKYLVKSATASEAGHGDTVGHDAEQSSMLFRSVRFLYRLGRSFLGLTAQTARFDDLRDPNQQTPTEDSDYIWHNQPFPRIRLSTGEELPGSVPLSPWRYGVPRFTPPNANLSNLNGYAS